MTYKLTSGDTIHRLTDNAFIPPDPSNSDYQAYLAWREEGNTPLPAPDPIIGDITDLPEAKKVASEYVRSKAYSLLQPTDWVVVREMESGVPAPADITAYRAAVRTASADKVTTIESAGDLDDLTAYLRSDEFAAWPEPPTT